MPEAILPFDSDTDSYECMKNIGYVAVSSVFHTLGIHTFFDRRCTYLDISYNLTSVVKLLVYELGYKFSGGKIITSLRKANVVELNSTTFKTLYYDRVLQKLKEAMGIDFGKNVYTRAEIRSMVAKSKKTS